ncbi:MAG: paraquat-inducible protein A [Thermodesulfobacteriota bacterium]
MSQALTARAAGYLDCHVCHLLVSRPAVPPRRLACPRCGAALHQRKPDSLSRTWALLLAAVILYVPAMALPIMETATLTGVRQDTILSGVVYLVTSGMWPLAAIVFFASVVVPVLKILALSFLLVSVQRRSRWRPRDRTRLYRLNEAVGRWSMVDIYVVTVLTALVRLRALAVVEARPGALFFAAVVVSTMLAAMSFDPRLIWDRMEPPE